MAEATKKRGRPRLTEEEKAKRAADKAAKVPKKRGPKPKAKKQKPAPAAILATAEGLGGVTVSEPRPEGRPPSYKPEYAVIARKMCAMGATDHDLAEAFGVTTVTIWRWRSSHPEFCRALKVEKGEFDDRVERSLAMRAVGYTYQAVKIFMPAGSDAPIYAPYTEHVPPDPGAAKLWLVNRRGEEWRDKREQHLTIETHEDALARLAGVAA